MPSPGGGHIGHAKHHVAFGKSTYGPRARMQLQIELIHSEQERNKTNKVEMFGSVQELLTKKKSRKKR
jgi:hypothetical protein